MSKFCTKCGTELPNDARFCRGCGAKFEDDIQVDKATEEVPVEVKDKAVEVKTVEVKKAEVKTEKGPAPSVNHDIIKNVNTTVVIIAGMVLVTFIIVVMILTIGTNSKKANKLDVIENNEIALVEDEETQPIPKDNTPEVEDVSDSEIPTDTKDQESNENDNIPNESQTAEFMDIVEALELFVEDPYLRSVTFPAYGDFLSVESKEQFGMVVITSIDLNYAETYANEELPKNGYIRNVFENSEDGVYQYIADNDMGQTSQVIFNNGKMMLLVGESAAFER